MHLKINYVTSNYDSVLVLVKLKCSGNTKPKLSESRENSKGAKRHAEFHRKKKGGVNKILGSKERVQ